MRNDSKVLSLIHARHSPIKIDILRSIIVTVPRFVL
jgi:hypothetical protein